MMVSTDDQDEIAARINGNSITSTSDSVYRVALTYFRNQLNENDAGDVCLQAIQQIQTSESKTLITIDEHSETYCRIADFCTKIKQTEGDFFDMLPDQLNLTNSNVERTFLKLSKSTFKDSTSWGKIISFIVLTETFILHFAKQRDAESIGVISKCFKNFLESDLSPWISEEGCSHVLKKSSSSGGDMLSRKNLPEVVGIGVGIMAVTLSLIICR